MVEIVEPTGIMFRLFEICFTFFSVEKGCLRLRVALTFCAGISPKLVRYIVKRLFSVPGATASGSCCEPQRVSVTDM